MTNSHVVRSHGRPDFSNWLNGRNEISAIGDSNDMWAIGGYGTIIRTHTRTQSSLAVYILRLELLMEIHNVMLTVKLKLANTKANTKVN